MTRAEFNDGDEMPAVAVEFHLDGRRQLVRSLAVAFAIAVACGIKALTPASHVASNSPPRTSAMIQQPQFVTGPNPRVVLALQRQGGLP
jgi:hypothetical protein